MKFLKQGSFWSLILLTGINALLIWLIWFGHLMLTMNSEFLVWQYALIVVAIVLFSGYIFYQMWKQFRNIRW